MKEMLLNSLIGLISVIGVGVTGYTATKVIDLSIAFAAHETEFNSAKVAINRNTTDVGDIQANEMEEGKIIAQELNNLRLYIEESKDETIRQVTIQNLEKGIRDLAQNIALERAELDRLNRVINGGTAAPPSEETYRAKTRALANISASEVQMAAKSRELQRLMR